MKIQKLKNSTILVYLLLFLFISIGVFSCKHASEKTAEEMIEKSIADNTSVDVEKDKLIIKKWLEEISKEVPEFKMGDLDIVSNRNYYGEEKKWTIGYIKMN